MDTLDARTVTIIMLVGFGLVSLNDALRADRKNPRNLSWLCAVLCAALLGFILH